MHRYSYTDSLNFQLQIVNSEVANIQLLKTDDIVELGIFAC